MDGTQEPIFVTDIVKRARKSFFSCAKVPEEYFVGRKLSAVEVIDGVEANTRITDVILFIHGFTNQPHHILLGGAQDIQPTYGQSVLVLPVIWPSLNFQSGTGYLADRKRAERAGHAFRHAFWQLQDAYAARKRVGNVRFHIYAHSMGAWVLYNFSKTIPKSLDPFKDFPLRFGAIMLIAANSPVDMLQKGSKVGEILTDICETLLVTYSQRDKMLKFVDRAPIIFGRQDLGFHGPGNVSHHSNVISIKTEKIVGEIRRGNYHNTNRNDRFAAYIKKVMNSSHAMTIATSSPRSSIVSSQVGRISNGLRSPISPSLISVPTTARLSSITRPFVSPSNTSLPSNASNSKSAWRRSSSPPTAFAAVPLSPPSETKKKYRYSLNAGPTLRPSLQSSNTLPPSYKTFATSQGTVLSAKSGKLDIESAPENEKRPAVVGTVVREGEEKKSTDEKKATDTKRVKRTSVVRGGTAAVVEHSVAFGAAVAAGMAFGPIGAVGAITAGVLGKAAAGAVKMAHDKVHEHQQAKKQAKEAQEKEPQNEPIAVIISQQKEPQKEPIAVIISQQNEPQKEPVCKEEKSTMPEEEKSLPEEEKSSPEQEKSLSEEKPVEKPEVTGGRQADEKGTASKSPTMAEIIQQVESTGSFVLEEMPEGDTITPRHGSVPPSTYPQTRSVSVSRMSEPVETEPAQEQNSDLKAIKEMEELINKSAALRGGKDDKKRRIISVTTEVKENGEKTVLVRMMKGEKELQLRLLL
uniref:Uncharacterized protein n=1 Tax=Amorphochlora amoebiformis TaxID=1561963 RepID=A0A7S0CTK1_9EUKA